MSRSRTSATALRASVLRLFRCSPPVAEEDTCAALFLALAGDPVPTGAPNSAGPSRAFSPPLHFAVQLQCSWRMYFTWRHSRSWPSLTTPALTEAR